MPKSTDGMTMRTSRSWTRFIFRSLFLGVVTTFVIAWSSAALTSFDDVPWRYGSHLMRLESGGEFVRTEWNFGLLRSCFGIQITSTVACPGGLYDPVINLSIKELPGWSSIARHPFAIEPVDGHHSVWEEQAFGWPFLALHGRAQLLHDGSVFSEASTEHAIVLTPADKSRGTGMKLLPLWPVWGGLVTNSVLFGATYMCVFSVVVACRRRYRRNRGLCVICGYDLRAVDNRTCSECGNCSK